MSTVDQRAGVGVSRGSRLLGRVLLVLVGAAAATVLGWLLSTASASADVLPNLPGLPELRNLPGQSIGQSIDLPVADPVTGTLGRTVRVGGDQLPPPPADLNQVASQVHAAVSGFGSRVTPSVPTDLLPTLSSADAPVSVAPVSPVVAPAESVAMPGGSVGPVPLFGHHQQVTPTRTEPAGQPATSSRSGDGPSLPRLPAMPPAGSQDASTHAAGSPTGSPTGSQVGVQQFDSPASRSTTAAGVPHVFVATGEQPGITPD